MSQAGVVDNGLNPRSSLTITGDIGVASEVGNNITIFTNNIAAQGAGSTVLFSNSGSTSTLRVTDVNDNTLVGLTAGNLTLSGGLNTGLGSVVLNALTTGENNTAVGFEALNNVTTGSQNVAIGSEAMLFLTTGGDNIAIGYDAGSNYVGAESQNIVIGETGTAADSRVIRIGTPALGPIGQTSCFIAGIDGVNVGSVVKVVTENANQLGTANIVGSGGVSITPTANTITIGLTADGIYKSLSPYIVGTDIHSGFTTIATAIAQAVTDGVSSTNPANIYIKPKTTGGSYTENLTLVDGINLIGFSSTTTIIGNITFSTAGTASINGLRLQTNSNFVITVAGSAATILNVNNCFINCTNNSGISYSTSNTSSQINLVNCDGNLATTGIAYFSMSSTGLLEIRSGLYINTGNSTTANTCSAGSVSAKSCRIRSPVTTSGTGAIAMEYAKIETAAINTKCLIIGGSGSSNGVNSIISSGTATAMTVTTTYSAVYLTVKSTNAAVIDGAGVLSYGYVVFNDTGSTVTTATQTAHATLL